MDQYTRPATSSEVLNRYWEIWQNAQPRTMGEIMKSLSVESGKPVRTYQGQRLIGF